MVWRPPRPPKAKRLQIRGGPGRAHRMVVLLLTCALALVSMPLSVASAPIAVSVDQHSWLKEAAPNDNFGTEKELPSKNKPGDSERAVLRFNLSPIPPKARIQSAIATFRVTTPDPSPVHVFRITKAPGRRAG